MVLLRKVRAVAGLAAVVTLLGLITAEFFLPGTIEPGRIQLLVALIGALLGVDLAGEYLPVGDLTVEVSRSPGDGSDGSAEKNTNEDTD